MMTLRKMASEKYTIIILILFLSMSCGIEESTINPDPNDWLVPFEDVFDGGPGKDGIPSIDNPQFTLAQDIDFLETKDLIIALEFNGEIVGYPHPIMDWHEIVNDEVNGLPVAITYCPLTGTTIAWERMVDGEETTFGVSGLLYNSNLIPYDRKTDSNWSQVLQTSINGSEISTKASFYPSVEMNWSTFLQAFPMAKVLNVNTGFSRNYEVYPYGDYRTNNNRLIFPVDETDDRIPQKERVLSVFSGEIVSSYRFSQVETKGGILTGEIGDTNFSIIGNAQENYLVAFKTDDVLLSPIVDSFPTIAKDESGNIYDVFGRSSTTTDLINMESYIGYWFTFPAFFDNVEIYE